MDWINDDWFTKLVTEVKEAISEAGHELSDEGNRAPFQNFVQRRFNNKEHQQPKEMVTLVVRAILADQLGLKQDDFNEAYRLAPSLKKVRDAIKKANLEKHIQIGESYSIADGRIKVVDFQKAFTEQALVIRVD